MRVRGDSGNWIWGFGAWGCSVKVETARRERPNPKPYRRTPCTYHRGHKNKNVAEKMAEGESEREREVGSCFRSFVKGSHGHGLRKILKLTSSTCCIYT